MIHTSGGLRGLLVVGIAVSLSTRLAAEDAKPADAETIKALTEAYAKLDGYMGVYHSEKKRGNATLDVTVGMDEASGVAVIRMNATKEGKASELKQWCTAGGTIYAGGGDDLFRLDVYALGNKLLSEMQDVAELGDSILSPSVVTSVCLEKENVGMGLGLGDPNQPPWSKWIEGSTIKESTVEDVTFATVGHGDLTISRKSGLLVRQSMAGVDGEVRVLELRDLKLNPGQGKVTEVSAGWKTDGARPMEGGMVMLFRRKFIVALVEAVDDGGIKLIDLQEFLKKKQDALVDFLKDSVSETKGSLAANPVWEVMLDKEKLKKSMMPAVEKGIVKDIKNEEELDRMFSDRTQRATLRDGFIKGLLNQDGLPEKALGAIFGAERGVVLPSKTADGKAAAESVQGALVRAYFTVLIDRKMLAAWGPPKDP